MIGWKKEEESLHWITRRAKQRLDRLAQPDVLQWADVAGAGIARNLSEYTKHGRREDLEETYEAVLTLLGCVLSLKDRA